MAEVGTKPVRAQRKDRAPGAWTNLVEEAEDGGEGTVEPVVNVYTKLKDNKRCVSCALWGRRRFFGDWEWREAKPRCKKCVKSSEKAKDTAKFGRRADFIAMNRTASSARGGTASDSTVSDFGVANERAARADSKVSPTRASDASRRPRSVAALRERRLSAGSNANPRRDGFGALDDDDDDEAATTTTSPPRRDSPGDDVSVSARARRMANDAVSRHGANAATATRATRANASITSPVSPDGDDWAGAYFQRRGERGYDPAAEARALEAALPTRAQRVLERAAILAGGSFGDSYRPTSVMSDAGPRGGRAFARRFGRNGETAAAAAARLSFPRGDARRDDAVGEDDALADEPFVSRVPEVRRSSLYPGAGYVPVRERLRSGDAGAARYGRSVSASLAARRGAESAPVTPLYRRRGETTATAPVSAARETHRGGFTGGTVRGGSIDRVAEPSASRGEETNAAAAVDAGSASRAGPGRGRGTGPGRPSSYVAGLMGKSGFTAASPLAEASASPRTPRAPSHLDARAEGRAGGGFADSGSTPRMSAADLDRALSASRETLSSRLAPAAPSAPFASPAASSSRSRAAISKPSQELDARLSMYAPGGGKKDKKDGQKQKQARSERKPSFGPDTKPRSSSVAGNRRGALDAFDELRPTPKAEPSPRSAASTPFDAVPSAFEALALREAAEEEDARNDGALVSNGEVPPGPLAGPLAGSPGSGLWYGSSAKTPGRAFRAVLDARRLAEEDAFAYKGLRTGRFVLDPDGAAARAYLRAFVRDARAKRMTPDWWTDAHSARLVERALDPADEIGLDFASHIGEPDGATRDELVERWGVAGTEALRDFHFDVRPEPWDSSAPNSRGGDDNDDDDEAGFEEGAVARQTTSPAPPSDVIRVADAEAARALAASTAADADEEGSVPARVVCVVAPGSKLDEDANGDGRDARARSVGLPDWEDADAATRGVVVALREAGAACAPLAFSARSVSGDDDGDSDGALALRGKKAVVFLGVGGESRADDGDDASISGDGCRLVARSASRVDALRAFVDSGGVFVVNGSGEHAERAFAWFGLPWRFAGESARGEYAPNVDASDAFRAVSKTRGAANGRVGDGPVATLDAWARGERGFYAVAAEGIVHVAPAHRVFTRVRASALSPDAPGGGGGGGARDPCPLAAARYGLGLVVFAGDRGGGDATCELIASLACLPPGETREYPGK